MGRVREIKMRDNIVKAYINLTRATVKAGHG